MLKICKVVKTNYGDRLSRLPLLPWHVRRARDKHLAFFIQFDREKRMQTARAAQIQTILTDAYLFFTSHIKTITAVCLPFLFAASFFDFILAKNFRETPLAIFSPLALNLLIYPLYTAALIQLMAARARKEQPGNGALIVAALQQWFPLLILKTVSVFIIGLGISMLILPGIWLAVRLAFAEFHLVLFGVSPKVAIQKSFADTRNHIGLVFVLLFVTYVPIFILGLGADSIVQTLTGNEFLRIVVNTVSSLIALFVHVVLFRAFMDVIAEPAPAPPPTDGPQLP